MREKQIKISFVRAPESQEKIDTRVSRAFDLLFEAMVNMRETGNKQLSVGFIPKKSHNCQKG
ncbi:MAG: hypothetical protein WC412_08410 [Candidatus Omnitrophota bacterium]|jgi:hypothetical protein